MTSMKMEIEDDEFGRQPAFYKDLKRCQNGHFGDLCMLFFLFQSGMVDIMVWDGWDHQDPQGKQDQKV